MKIKEIKNLHLQFKKDTVFYTKIGCLVTIQEISRKLVIVKGKSIIL